MNLHQTEQNNSKSRAVANNVGNQNNSEQGISLMPPEINFSTENIQGHANELLQFKKDDRKEIPNFLQVWNKNQENIPGPIVENGKLVGYIVEEGQGPTQIADDINKRAIAGEFTLIREITYLDIIYSNMEKFTNVKDIYNQDELEFENLNMNPGDRLDINIFEGEWTTISSSETIVTGNWEPIKKTSTHLEIIEASKQFGDIEFDEWNIVDILKWQSGKLNINEYKISFVKSFATVINDASNKFNIDPVMLAAIAFSESGGDEVNVDYITWHTRYVTSGLESANKTSFGYLSMQVRRAGETLDYSTNLSYGESSLLIRTLMNPVQNFYLVAKHLAELKEIDFPDKNISELNINEKAITVSRYKYGPFESKENLEKKKSYGGNQFIQRYDEFKEILKNEN